MNTDEYLNQASQVHHIAVSGVRQRQLSVASEKGAIITSEAKYVYSECAIYSQAFIHEVQAQAGKHIDAMHTQHMVMHAQLVIQALTNG